MTKHVTYSSVSITKYSPQFTSSDPSMQSVKQSQKKASGIHSPVVHRSSVVSHVLLTGGGPTPVSHS